MILTLKLSDADQERFGIKTADDAMALLEGAAETSEALQQTKAEAVEISKKLSGFDARLKSIEAAEPPKPDIKALIQEAKGEIESTARTEANRVTMDIISRSGGKPLTSTETPDDVTKERDGKKTFADVVGDKVKTGMTKPDAVRWAIANHPEEYRAQRSVGIKL